MRVLVGGVRGSCECRGGGVAIMLLFAPGDYSDEYCLIAGITFHINSKAIYKKTANPSDAPIDQQNIYPPT